MSLLLLLPCTVSLSIPNPPADIRLKRFQENRARTEKREAATKGLISALRQAQQVITEKKIGEIEPVFQNVQNQYKKWKANTAQEREWILRTGLPAVALERHDNATAQLDAKLQSLMQTLEQLRDNAKAGQVGALQGKPLTDVQRIFADLIQDPKELELKNPTPFRTSPNEKVFTKQARPQLAASSPSAPLPFTTTDTPTPGDLQETEEVQFTTAITNLATSLNNDALEIFQYVQNQIDFIPYYGSKKGADNTLLEKAGNDADVASLLIALLRVSNIPSRYVQGKIQLTPQQTMEWLGVNDPWTAVQVIANGLIPHEVFVDASDPTTIVFVQMEHIWVEAYVPYGNYRGLGGDQSNKIWVPLDPSWKKYFYTQNVNIPDEMGFDIDAFYNNYLSGVQADTPLTTYRNQLTSYLSTAYPNLSYNDILTRQYRLEETFDFLPNTLPYEVVEISDTPSALPAELRHQLRIKIADDQTTFLDTMLEVLDVANQQVVLSAVAATAADQAIIDQNGGIYQTPPNLVNLKPVVRINGQEITSGTAYGMGLTKTLSLDFLMPKKVNGVLNLVEKEHVEKNTILGNDEGIAINTDRIVLPELREQTLSTEFVNGQKLYRSALNYLEGLQSSQEEIGKTFGATFTNTATRAIVFNGIDVIMVAEIPQTFTWKGLRIDASANIRYHSHFGDVDSHKKEFLMIWGLDGSFAEATLFEDDYAIEAMSTVKGLTLINEGTISGVTVQTISSGNQADIENLNVSENTKVVFRDAVNQGKIVYTPDQQFTYLNWTGLVYIVLDPEVGDGGYIIGEGLNGGYTACDVPDLALPNVQVQMPPNMCFWDEEAVHFFRSNESSGLEIIATLDRPQGELEFIRNAQTIEYRIVYQLFWDEIREFVWDEKGLLDTSKVGTFTLCSSFSGQNIDCWEYEVLPGFPDPIQNYREPTTVRPDLEEEHPCFDAHNYNCFNHEIEDAVNFWNNFFSQQKFPPPQLLEYNLVKALIYKETGMGYHEGPNDPFPDIIQVGNPGDPAIPVLNNDGTYPTEFEFYTGKEVALDYKGVANADTYDKSIHWGVRWLYRKMQGHHRIPTGNTDFPYKPDWQNSWKEAVKGYGPDKTSQTYVESIWKTFRQGKDPQGGKNLF